MGSTKRGVATSVGDRARFIGGHPVCGSEAHGPEHANGELFQGATWFLTPVAETDPERYRALHAFVASLGAVPVAVDARAHDRLVALTSHLPHALANALLNQAGSVRVVAQPGTVTASNKNRANCETRRQARRVFMAWFSRLNSGYRTSKPDGGERLLTLLHAA